MTTATATATATAPRLDAFNRLGTPLLSTTDAEQALKAGGLWSWNVRKAPAYCIDPKTGENIEMERTNGVIYDRPEGGVGYFGRVGDAHHIIQNEEQIEFLQIFADEAGATFETAGVAKQGRRVFITMKLPGRLIIGGTDPVDMYVASINSHDGNFSHTLLRSPVRFACMNMMNIARKEATFMAKVRHTKGARKMLEAQAHRMLEETFDYMDEFRALADELTNKTMTQSTFEQILESAFGASDDAPAAAHTRADKKIEEIVELFTEANTQAGIRDTAWAGLNALVEWADHLSPTTGATGDEARASKAILDPSFKNTALQLMLNA